MKCIIAIPCFRESSRLPPFLDSLCRELETAPFEVSIVIVDDGSGAAEAEKTRAIVEEFRKKFARLIAEPVFLPENRGKGGAVYAGWAGSSDDAAADDLLCFVDADGSVPAAEVRRLIGELITDESKHWGALFGSRIKLLGNEVSRLASRHYIGRIFATLTTLITGIEVYDSQCGLKVLRRGAFETIKKDLDERRFVFDVELTVLLLERGFRIREIPIRWHEVAGSKVRVVRDSIRMFMGLVRIRRRKAARAT
jgi:dolichyl-phosphate beta-glucosyltransferase